MSLSLAEIQRVVEEIRPLLVGGRLDTATQPSRTSVLLTFYAQRAKHHLMIEANPQFARLHLTARKPPATGDVPPFAQSVRRGLRGRALTSIEVAGGDRVVELVFGRPDAPAGRLVAELTGRSSNLYHVGPDGRVLAVVRPVRGDRAAGNQPPPNRQSGPRLAASRAARPGAAYEPPPPPPESLAAGADRFADAPSPSEAVEEFYTEAALEEQTRVLRATLTAQIRSARKRTGRLLDNLERDTATQEDADHLRLCGELLKYHLGQIEPRQRSIALPNLFEAGAPDVTIPLQPNLSARANMERYFHRFKRLSEARRHNEARLAAARAKLDDLSEKAIAVQAAVELAELEAIAADLGVRKAVEPRRRAPKAAGPRRFVSADGLEILVGRSPAENDQITFRVARGNDLWLHVEGYTGSHVIVRVPRDKTAPKETLLDAATLAVQFSQLRKAGAGPVAYCARKHVQKPRGSGPGQVLYSQSKTLHITVEKGRLGRLMGGGLSEA